MAGISVSKLRYNSVRTQTTITHVRPIELSEWSLRADKTISHACILYFGVYICVRLCIYSHSCHQDVCIWSVASQSGFRVREEDPGRFSCPEKPKLTTGSTHCRRNAVEAAKHSVNEWKEAVRWWVLWIVLTIGSMWENRWTWKFKIGKKKKS